MREMVANVIGLSGKIPDQTVKLFQSLRTIHDESIPSAGTIRTEINALRPGYSFAMFVRRQNCMFIIHAPTKNGVPNDVIVATFPGNLHPNEVYQSDSDIEVN